MALKKKKVLNKILSSISSFVNSFTEKLNQGCRMQTSVSFAVWCLVLLIHSNKILGGLIVTGTISNESAVAIGFGEFVTYQSYGPVQVSCRADPLPVNGILELFQDDRRLKLVEANTLDAVIELYSIHLDGGSNAERPINFSCRSRITSDPVSGDRINYIVEHSFTLKLRQETLPFNLCASSIGSSVTLQESSYLFCGTDRHDTTLQLMWTGQEAIQPSYDDYCDNNYGILYILPLMKVSSLSDPMTCYITRSAPGRREICSLPNFQIVSEPTVSISPKSLLDSVDSMSFSCQSNPPSRIRWVVTGDYGDILDYDLTVNFFVRGELNISIQEMAGTSNITLNGSAVPSLKINTIYCITYGRQYTGIGIAKKETSPDITPSVLATSSHSTLTSSLLEKNNGITADVTSPAAVSSADGKSRTNESEIEDNVTVDDTLSVTVPSTGSKQTSSVGKNDSDIDGIKGSNDTTFIIIIIILVAGILILAVTCMLLYLRVKRSATTTKIPNEKDYKLEHINCTYEPYHPYASATAPYAEVTDAQYSVPGEH